MEIWQKAFGFLDNCIWIGCMKFSLILREYFSWAVNVLTKSPSVANLTKRDLFQLNWSYNDKVKQ